MTWWRRKCDDVHRHCQRRRDGGQAQAVGASPSPAATSDKSLEEGASLACDGCCLTLVDVQKAKEGRVFAVEASNETLARTTLFAWQEGRRINLERPLTLGDELGGHIVTGHVDAAAMILERDPDGDSVQIRVRESARPRPLHRRERFGRARWRLAHR